MADEEKVSIARYMNPDHRQGWFDGFLYHNGGKEEYELPEQFDPGPTWEPRNEAGERAMSRVRERLAVYAEIREIEVELRSQGRSTGGIVDEDLVTRLAELRPKAKEMDKAMRERQKKAGVFYPNLQTQLQAEGAQIVDRLKASEKEIDRLRSELAKSKLGGGK